MGRSNRPVPQTGPGRCNLCERHVGVKTVCMSGAGPRQPRLVVIGEGPSFEEDTHGIPFIGPAGRLLDQALIEAGYDLTHIYKTNTVRCLGGNTCVYMADGSVRTIRELVKTKHAGPILSVTEEGEVVASSVVGWYRNSRANRVLLHVSNESTRFTRGFQHRAGSLVTDDHEFLTRDGWVMARDLNGKQVATGHIRPLSLSGIRGAVLGDGHLDKRGGFSFTHTARSRDYALLKCQLFSRLTVAIQERPENILQGHPHSTIVCRIGGRRSAPFWKSLREYFYPNGVKIVPKDMVLELMDLVIWFLDDGSGRHVSAEFATNSFTENECHYLIWQLSNCFGLNARVIQGPRIALTQNNSKKLFELIACYIPNSMQYKLPIDYRGRFDMKVWAKPISTELWFSKAVVNSVPPNKYSDAVFCLEISNTQNFLTPGGVVHNCGSRPLKPKMLEIRRCRPYLFDELMVLDYSQCVGVFLLGETAVKGFLDDAFLSVRETRLRVLDRFGPATNAPPNRPPEALDDTRINEGNLGNTMTPGAVNSGVVVPPTLLLPCPLRSTYHPSACLPHHDPEQKLYGELVEDLRTALKPRDPLKPLRYANTVDELSHWFPHPCELGMDLEWRENGTIRMVGLSDGRTNVVCFLPETVFRWIAARSVQCAS